MTVGEGETVALIGPNGSGKSTALLTVFGMLRPTGGSIRLRGEAISGHAPDRGLALGLAFCPQGRRVFRDLTVAENLAVGGVGLSRGDLKARFGAVLPLFPALGERLHQPAGRLSGGEQQMVAVARALLLQPRLLLLDEPSLGLAPNLVAEVLQTVKAACRGTGAAALVVEQKVRDVLSIADRAYGLRLGRVVAEFTPAEATDELLREIFLGDG